MRSNRSEVFVVPFNLPGQPQYYLGERKVARVVNRITVIPAQQCVGPAEVTTLGTFAETTLRSIFITFCDPDGEVLLKDMPAAALINAQKGAPPAALVPKPRLNVGGLLIAPWRSYAYCVTPKTGSLLVQFEYAKR